MDADTRAIERLYTDLLKVDDYWAVRTDAGFTWWADKQAQTIAVAGRQEGGPDGAVGTLIGVRTDVLRGVDLDEEKWAALNREVMSFASMAGLVHDPEARTLTLCSLAMVWEHNEAWLAPFFSMAAVLQLWEARALASQLAAPMGAEAAFGGHPEHGVRAQPDEMADAVANLVVPTGKGPSVWSPAEFTAAAKALEDEPSVLEVAVDPGGLAVDVPFGDVAARCQLLPGAQHPAYGSGLLVLQQFPVAPPTEAEGAGLSLALNGIELAREPLGYGFGSYAWREERLHFLTFLPNALYMPGLLPHLVASGAQRARSLYALFARSGGGDASGAEAGRGESNGEAAG